jgi:hypothetical protein
MSVVTAATVATAGAPGELPPANASQRNSRPHALDLSAPRTAPLSEPPRPLWLDQSRGSSATSKEETRQFAKSTALVGMRPQPILVIHWQTEPDLLRIARNLRRNGLPVVSLWRSGRSLAALGVSPRGVPGLYFTQKAQD